MNRNALLSRVPGIAFSGALLKCLQNREFLALQMRCVRLAAQMARQAERGNMKAAAVSNKRLMEVKKKQSELFDPVFSEMLERATADVNREGA